MTAVTVCIALVDTSSCTDVGDWVRKWFVRGTAVACVVSSQFDDITTRSMADSVQPISDAGAGNIADGDIRLC